MALGDLSTAERQLLAAATTGSAAHMPLLGLQQLAETLDAERVIRAAFLRELLLGQRGDGLDPRGVRVASVRVVGRLELEHGKCLVGLALLNCAVDEAISLEDAEVPWVHISGSQLPGLSAAGSRISGRLAIDDTCIRGATQSVAIDLTGARIGGDLRCSRVDMSSKSGPVFLADRLHLEGSALMGGTRRSRVTITTSSRATAVSFIEGRVGGHMDLAGAQLSNDEGAAFAADGLEVAGGLFLRYGFRASGSGPRATVRISSAAVGRGLDFQGARIYNPDGLALDLRATSTKWLRMQGDLAWRSQEEQPSTTAFGDGDLLLDGLTYSGLAPYGDALETWTGWLTARTPSYSAQPYQQLAMIHRASGHEQTARQVLIT